jgi:DNA-binding MarR family transcriptional regulator
MMSSQAAQLPAAKHLEVWTRLMAVHGALARELEQDLTHEHGLTLSDYQVLARLAAAPGGRLRPVELSRAVLLTRSGITRLVQGLEEAGLVRRVDCSNDRRGTWVELTDAGRRALRRATNTHAAGIEARFTRQLSPEELDLLGDLLARLPRRTAADGRRSVGSSA